MCCDLRRNDLPDSRMANGMTRVYNRIGSSSDGHVKNAEREKSLSRWQERREWAEKG